MKIAKIVSKVRDGALLAPMALVGMHPASAGPADALVNYWQTDVVGAIGTLATIGVGLYMLSRKADLTHIVVVCAGIWVVTNASTISAMFAHG